MNINIGLIDALEHMDRKKACQFLEEEIQKIQQDAFMAGYEYAITVLLDTLGSRQRKRPDD